MDNMRIKPEKEGLHFTLNQDEKAILGQVARLLVSEKLITQEEQIRFLAFLKEGE